MKAAVLDRLVRLRDRDLQRPVAGYPLQFHLYAALRREQRAVVAAHGLDEPSAILGFARSAYDELSAFLADREVLDSARDGDWTLRHLLRHGIAVELRYAEQVQWSASRRNDEPIAIPEARLPCDRLTPPEPEFADAKTGDMARVLELLGRARARTDERLAGVATDALTRASLWGSAQIDVRERLHQIGVHLVEVLIQAEKMLGASESEVRRITRRIAAARGLHEAKSDVATLVALDDQIAFLDEQL